jgi:hypothetical protein
MPLDTLSRTRATLTLSISFCWSDRILANLSSKCRDRDRSLQLWILNEEFLVSTSHQLVLITSLQNVHIARRLLRLSNLVSLLD